MDMGNMVTSSYMAHGFCLNWEPSLVALHVGSDIIIGISYYSIPLVMFYYAYRRRDIPFFKIFILFAFFILSCGTTHLLSAYTIYRPEYWMEGYAKALTAIISAVTVIVFIPRIPEAIALPSVMNSLEEIRQLNGELAQKNTELQIANYSIENVLDSVYWVSADARILRVNNAACKALGYQQLTNRVVGVDGKLADLHAGPDQQRLQLLNEGITFTGDGRVDLTKTIPIVLGKRITP